MNKTKLLSLLGLSRRAGKLIYGFDSAVESLKSKKAKCLIYALDISEKTEKVLPIVTGTKGSISDGIRHLMTVLDTRHGETVLNW